MVDLIVLIFMLTLFYRVEIYKELNSDTDPLSKENTLSKRGIFAILIVLFHLSQQIDSGITFRLFGEIGYLAVGYFFFLSGYGLLASANLTGGGITKHFFASGYQRYCYHGVLQA